MKLPPLNVSVVVFAGSTLSGVALTSNGIGFITPMRWVVDFVGSSTLVATTVTMLLGVGTTAGA